MLLFGVGASQLPRPAAPLRRVVDAPPQRARGDAARAAARPARHAGRRAHLRARRSRSRTRSSAASTSPPTSTTCSAWRRASSSRRGPRTSSAPTRSGTSPRPRSRSALERREIEYTVNEGDGAFYGPKIDLHMTDVLGRSWQMGTIQLDSQMPARFGLTYMGADNGEHTPYVIHRALFGSLERFIGILIEHYGGAFPFWLAPVQVRIIPVGEDHRAAAHALAEKLAELPRRGRRARRDGRQADPRRRGREDPVRDRLRRQGVGGGARPSASAGASSRTKSLDEFCATPCYAVSLQAGATSSSPPGRALLRRFNRVGATRNFGPLLAAALSFEKEELRAW